MTIVRYFHAEANTGTRRYPLGSRAEPVSVSATGPSESREVQVTSAGGVVTVLDLTASGGPADFAYLQLTATVPSGQPPVFIQLAGASAANNSVIPLANGAAFELLDDDILTYAAAGDLSGSATPIKTIKAKYAGTGTATVRLFAQEAS